MGKDEMWLIIKWDNKNILIKQINKDIKIYCEY